MEQSDRRAMIAGMLASLQEQLASPGARTETVGPIQQAMLKGYIAEHLATHHDPVLEGMLREFPEQPTLLDAVVVLRTLLGSEPAAPAGAPVGARDGVARPGAVSDAVARLRETGARLPADARRWIREAPAAAARWALWLCTATDPFSDALKILFVSTTFTILALYSEGLTTSADTHQFLDWATAMARGGSLPANPPYASRNIGYPLLLWISGYPYTHSLAGIAVIQAAMAVATPLLIYFAVRRLSAAAGYYAAIASDVSLGAVYNMKYVSHDFAFNFFLVLSAYLCVQYFVSGSAADLYRGSASFLMTAVIQPMGNLLFPTFLVLGFAFVRGPFRRYALCLGVGVVLLVGNLYYRHMLFGIPVGRPMPTIVGSQAFYAPYLNSHQYGITLSPDIGPAMRELIARVDRTVPSDPKQLRSVLGDRYEKGPGQRDFGEKYYYSLTPSQLRSNIFTSPNFEYYQFVIGATNDEHLDLAAALEIYRRYPVYIAEYTLDNVWTLLTAPGLRFTQFYGPPGMLRVGNPFPLDQLGYVDLNRFPPGAPAIKELRFNDHPPELRQPGRTLHDRLRARWPTISAWYVRVTFAFILGGLLMLFAKYLLAVLRLPRLAASRAVVDDALPTRLSFAFLALGILLLELYALTGLMTEADLRIWHQVDGLRLVIAGLGAGAVINLFGGLLRRSPAGARLVGAVSAMTPEPSARVKKILAVLLAVWAVAGILSWVVYLTHHLG